MSMPQIGPIKRAWYRWKMLRLPWRKRFLVGLDLRGNTYWTFLDQRADTSVPTHLLRWRRIVKYPRSTHYSDVTVPPQWHQWLRHRREHPPSLAEQQAEVARQENMKTLAAQADARWQAKPSLVDMPVKGNKGQPVPALNTVATQSQEQAAQARQGETGHREGTNGAPKVQEDPWKKAASGPSETWQPTAWSPTTTRKR